MVAAATFTQTSYSKGPLAHIGLNARAFTIHNDTFLNTISNTMLIAKLPPVCEILGCFIKGTNAGVAGIYVLRVEDTDACITLTGVSLATPFGGVGSNVSVRPFRVSLSDGAPNQFARLRLEATAAGVTTTISLAGVLLYSVGSTDI